MMKQWSRRADLHFHLLWDQYSAVIIFLILYILFSILNHGFASPSNLLDMLLSNTGLIIVVTGLSIVMIGGGIDLSIGYQISLISAVISLLSMNRLPGWAVIIGALTTGVLCGFINGILVGYLGIVPFAATIASQIIFRGLSFALSSGRMVSNFSAPVRMITKITVLGIRMDLLLAFATMLIMTVMLHETFFGKKLRAVGLNMDAAIRAGIKIPRIQILSYSFAGICYALAAMVMVSQRGYSGSEIGVGMEISAIVAAYMSGVLRMGESQMTAMLLFGVMILAITENGLERMGINTSIRFIVTGFIMIISMAVHRKQGRIRIS